MQETSSAESNLVSDFFLFGHEMVKSSPSSDIETDSILPKMNYGVHVWTYGNHVTLKVEFFLLLSLIIALLKLLLSSVFSPSTENPFTLSTADEVICSSNHSVSDSWSLKMVHASLLSQRTEN